MKKLKLNVIEEGRALKPTELNALKGGMCTVLSPYSSCSDSRYTTCGSWYDLTECFSHETCVGYASCNDDFLHSCDTYEHKY